MSILIETFTEQANYQKEVVGYECNGHRHITDLCRELKNVHVYSYLQIFISVFAVVGCVLFRKNIKYIWPQIIPALLAISSSSVYLAIFYKEHSDVWLNETKAFNAVIAMSLTTILITVIVMCQIAVFFFWFERIFHQKKSFCTTTFLYTTTFLALTFAIQTCITSTGWKYAFGVCHDAEADNNVEKFGNIVYWGLEHCNLGTGC